MCMTFRFVCLYVIDVIGFSMCDLLLIFLPYLQLYLTERYVKCSIVGLSLFSGKAYGFSFVFLAVQYLQ